MTTPTIDQFNRPLTREESRLIAVLLLMGNPDKRLAWMTPGREYAPGPTSLARVAGQLEAYAEQFGGRICEDASPEVLTSLDAWPADEREALSAAMHVWNGDPEAYEPGYLSGNAPFLMAYYAAKLRNLAGLDDDA